MKKLIFLISLLIATSQAWATNYFVKDDGNDSLDGLTDATAWRTIGKVNEFSFNTGDDVYFKCGNTWTNQQLTIDWSGTSENHVVIGAYYGAGTIGVSGTKPIIQGTDKKRETETPYPTNNYAGLIISDSQNYLDFVNLQVTEAAGRGLNISNASNILINTCYLYGAYRSVAWFREISGLTISYSTIGDGGWSEPDSGNAPGVLQILESDTVLISHNIVPTTVFEGIYIENSQNVVAEYNKIKDVGTRAFTLLYSTADAGAEECRDITIRHNLVYGGDVNRTSDPNDGVNSGVSINDGSMYSVYNVYIYGNLFFDLRKGLYLCTTTLASYIGPLHHVYFYNNTVINCNESIYWGTFGTGNNVFFSNNIFAQFGSGDHCTGRSSFSGLSGDYNLWYGNLSTVDLAIKGAHDIEANPIVSYGNYWAIGYGPTVTDFALQSGSPAIDSGEDLGDSYDDGLDALLTDLPDTVTLLDRDNFGAGWDIGAAEFKGGALVTDPTGLIQVGYSTEEDVRTVGGTLTITLSDAIWAADVTTDLVKLAALHAGVHGNLSTDTVWNTLMTETLIRTVRVNDSVLTIEISPWADYDIDTTETITTTIPASCTNAGASITCNSFYISAIIPASVASGVGYSQTGKQVLYSPTSREWRYLGE